MNTQDLGTGAPPDKTIPGTAPDAATTGPTPIAPRTTCANCGTTLIGRYCHSCSQASGPTSVSLHDALHDFVYMMFKIDNKFVRALKTLVTAPGKLSLDYKNGIVVPYTRPLRLIFVISLSVFILFALLDIKFLQQTITFTPEARVTRDVDGLPVLQGAQEDILSAKRTVPKTTTPSEFLASLDRELANPENGWFANKQLRLWKMLALGDPMQDFWSKGLPFILLAISPLFAGLLALFYRRSGYLFSDHLVFAVHVNSFALLTSVVPAVLLYVWPAAAELNLELVLFLGYMILACRTFYGSGWTASVFKGLALGVLNMALFTICSLGVMGIALAFV